MTNKVQYSKKFPDGTILVIGGDTVEEFEELYTKFKQTEVARAIFQESTAPPKAQQSYRDAGETTNVQATSDDVFWVTLPANALLEVTRKGGKEYGDISPFPGTKYPVRVWPEVMNDFAGFTDDTWEFDMGGWEVGYVKNEKGYPQKVVDVK